MASLAGDSVVGVGDISVSTVDIIIKGLVCSEHCLLAAESFCECISCVSLLSKILSVWSRPLKCTCKAVC